MLVLKTSYLMISPIKNYLNFGKRGIQKFRENINKNVNINGYTDDVDIANEFAEHFKNVHYTVLMMTVMLLTILRFMEQNV